MKDPQAEDTAPLAPRRTLTGPAQPSDVHGTRNAARTVSADVEQTRSFPAPPLGDRPAPASGNGAALSAAPAPRPGESVVTAGPATTPQAPPAPTGRPRRARLRVARVDPWSVMKIAFALSIALAIVTIVAVAIVWSILGAAGVWDSINASVAASGILTNNQSFNINDYVGSGRVVGLTMIIAVADVVLITAISTLGAFLYNLAAALLGGYEVTLAETR